MVPHLGASTNEAQLNVATEMAHQVVDALTKDDIRNALNIPYVEPSLREILGPFTVLGEHLGSMAAQLFEGALKKVTVTYSGDIIDYDCSYVTVAITKGIFAEILDLGVNYVNAPVIAKNRGVNISEVKSSDIVGYKNLVSVQLEDDKGGSLKITGTIFPVTKEPRVVRLDGYHMDAIPKGYMLVVRNNDKPGVVGLVGTVLGDNGLNIADMTLGRQEKGKAAVLVLNVDDKPSDEVIKKLEDNADIISAKVVYLPQ